MTDVPTIGLAILLLLVLGFACAVTGAWLIAGIGPALAVAAALLFVGAGILMRSATNG